MLYGAILRSEYPHAFIKSIDTGDALKLCGVKAVITFEDVPNTRYNPIFNAPYPATDLIPKDKSIMRREVCYVGEPVAAVAAESMEVAEDALERISVDYDPLPFILDPLEAIKPEAPKIRTDLKRNIAEAWGAKDGNPIVLSYGDIDRGFKVADEIFEDTYHTQRQNQIPFEPHSCLTYWDEWGKLNVWSSTQSIFMLREKLSEALNVPVSMIKVHNTYVGGAFGSKLQMSEVEPICALLSKKAKRPVKIVLRRDEVFVTTSRHDTHITLRTGVKKDGSITARYCKYVLNTGAYATHGPSVVIVGGLYFDASYNTPRLFEGYPVYTNMYSPGAMRGYGGIQVAFAMESQLDDIAQKMGLDPIELRLKNVFKKGDVNPRTGYVIKSWGLKDAVERASCVFGWDRPLEQPSSSTRRKGRGFAFQTIRGSGTGAKTTAERIIEHSGATVKFEEDGRFTVVSAAIDMGGGQHTVYANVAAETLGVDIDLIDFVPGDTEKAPFEGPVHASRGTYVIGSMIKSVCEKVRKEVLEAAADMLKQDPLRLTIKGREVISIDDPSKKVPLSQLGLYVRFHLNKSICVTMSGEPPDNPPPFGAHFAEVEVDLETGQVFVTKYVAAQDVAKVIYEPGIEGQIYGALVQGIGFTFMEEVKIDEEGRVINANLMDYKMPTIADMPQVKIILVRTQEPTGVGAKSVSEASLHPVAPAIANAIKDAIGIRFKSLPITPEKVLKAINQGKKEFSYFISEGIR